MSTRNALFFSVVVIATALPALAQPDTRPWARGVDKERQDRALALFREGNSALKESLFPKAAATYREALVVWDHPAVHYNLALALVNLDQPVEVHQHLTAALRFGAAPLDEEKFQQAQRYLALIERQLTKLTVTSASAGAAVKLDGKLLFTGPGKWEGPVRAGAHSLSATQEGRIADERSVALLGGETKTFDLRVYREEELTEYRRPFSELIPLVTLGVGVVALGTGAGLHVAARTGFQTFDDGVRTCASMSSVPNSGCIPTPDLQGVHASATGLQTGAYVLYATGGVALAASAVLFYAGRPIPYRKSISTEPQVPAVTVAPIISPTVVGALVAIEL